MAPSVASACIGTRLSGKIAEIRSYGLKHQLQSIWRYEYETDSSKVEVTHYDEGKIDEDSVSARQVESYDESGKILQLHLLGENAPYVIEKFRFDSEGNEIEVIRYAKAVHEPFMKKVQEYDGKGN